MYNQYSLFYILISILAISAIPLINLYTLYINKKKLNIFNFYMISFAVGSLLATAFFDLLPHSYSKLELKEAAISILIGFFIFFILELFFKHIHPYKKNNAKKIIGLVTLADTVHNFIDGIAIAASFLISTQLGIATSFAVFFHEIPQELSDTSIFLYHGASLLGAVILNLTSAAFAIIGGLATYFFYSYIQASVEYLLAFTAGGFIYLGAATLIPEIHKQEKIKKFIIQILFIIFGIISIVILEKLLGSGYQ